MPQALAAIPMILQKEGGDAELHLECTKGMVRGGDDYQQSIWGSPGPLAVVLMQNVFMTCSQGLDAAARAQHVAWERSGRFLTLISRYTSDKKQDREFSESYSYSGGFGGISMESGDLDPSATLSFTLSLKEPFLRHAASAMELGGSAGETEEELFSCMKDRFATPSLGLGASDFLVSILRRLNDDCGLSDLDTDDLEKVQSFTPRFSALLLRPFSSPGSSSQCQFEEAAQNSKAYAVLEGDESVNSRRRLQLMGGWMLRHWSRPAFLMLEV